MMKYQFNLKVFNFTIDNLSKIELISAQLFILRFFKITYKYSQLIKLTVNLCAS